MTPLTQLRGDGAVAARYGVEEAIFLDAVLFWYRTNRGDDRNFFDGRWWTHNSVKAYEQVFPWWSGKQIRRIIERCKAQGALLSGEYNKDRRDRTAWYSPSDELLALYGESISGKCICPNGQMQMPKRATALAQTGEPLPCNTHDITYTPYSPPLEEPAEAPEEAPPAQAPVSEDELFERFWEAYPKKRSKPAARRAWLRLRPGPVLFRAMMEALERQKRSRDWAKDAGQFIPYPATWLNQRRWEDEEDPAFVPDTAEASGDPWDSISVDKVEGDAPC